MTKSRRELKSPRRWKLICWPIRYPSGSAKTQYEPKARLQILLQNGMASALAVIRGLFVEAAVVVVED